MFFSFMGLTIGSATVTTCFKIRTLPKKSDNVQSNKEDGNILGPRRRDKVNGLRRFVAPIWNARQPGGQNSPPWLNLCHPDMPDLA